MVLPFSELFEAPVGVPPPATSPHITHCCRPPAPGALLCQQGDTIKRSSWEVSGIWIVSRSISTVQFSNVLKQGDTKQSRDETMSLALVSLLVSAVCVGIILLLPKALFSFIFGPEFGGVKQVVLLLAPGILAIAFSNVIGHYFSAIRQLNILIIKSAVGLLFTLALSFWLVPKWQVDGACVVNTVSYVVSSLVLLIYYQRRARLE